MKTKPYPEYQDLTNGQCAAMRKRLPTVNGQEPQIWSFYDNTNTGAVVVNVRWNNWGGHGLDNGVAIFKSHFEPELWRDICKLNLFVERADILAKGCEAHLAKQGLIYLTNAQKSV